MSNRFEYARKIEMSGIPIKKIRNPEGNKPFQNPFRPIYCRIETMSRIREERQKLDQLTSLSKIGLRARTVVDGFITGSHRSRSHGWNVEFAEFREYVKGDDIRHIDWKVYARTDRYFIKEFEEDTSMKTYLLLDQSRSMAFSGSRGGMTKLEYSALVASALSYLLIRQMDSVGLLTFDEELGEYLPPRSSLVQLNRIWQKLEQLEPKQKTAIPTILRNLAASIKRRGLIVLISDLLDDPVEVLKGLGHFRIRKCEVIVFHILDRAELDFPYHEHLRFSELESDRKMNVHSRAIRKSYLDSMQNYLTAIREGCFRANLDYMLWATDEPLERMLYEFLLRRQRIGR